MITQIDLLKKYGLQVKGHLGQHLLIDPNLQRKTVELLEIEKNDRILEIGPGLGALTWHIAGRCSEFWIVEKDQRFYRILTEELQSSITSNDKLIHEDFLKFDLAQLFKKRKSSAQRPFKVISNLPYYITAPILFHLFASAGFFSKMVFTMQKEVADRLLASPGNKDYGRLTLAVRYHAAVKHAFDVPASCFTPRPQVHSSVVVLDMNPLESRLDKKTETLLFSLINLAFSQRRKTLLHLLSHAKETGLKREDCLVLFSKLGFHDKIRGEELLLKDYVSMAEELISKVDFSKK